MSKIVNEINYLLLRLFSRGFPLACFDADTVNVHSLKAFDGIACLQKLAFQRFLRLLITSIVLGQYKDGVLTYKGHVTLGVSGAAFQKIQRQKRRNTPPLPVPKGHNNELAVWTEAGLVCTVKFMERTSGGGLRQPVFKGLREDKPPSECLAPED